VDREWVMVLVRRIRTGAIHLLQKAGNVGVIGPKAAEQM
jgi:hypothetical protein